MLCSYLENAVATRYFPIRTPAVDLLRSLILLSGLGHRQGRSRLLCSVSTWTARRTSIDYACWVFRRLSTVPFVASAKFYLTAILKSHQNIMAICFSGSLKIATLRIGKEPLSGSMVDQVVARWMVP